NLSQCPKCGLLAEPYEYWCPNVECLCGTTFCMNCSKRWTADHWHCDAEGQHMSVRLIDVALYRGFMTRNSSKLEFTMLERSIRARLSYFE
ncbi:hypothetical protein PMAYCL1PPCAC_00618, partial [Pristionchus mayeri]